MEAPRFGGFSITTARRQESLSFYEELGFTVAEDKHGGGRSCVDAPNQHFDVDDADAVLTWNSGSTGVGVTLGFEVDTQKQWTTSSLGSLLQAMSYSRIRTTRRGAVGMRWCRIQTASAFHS